MRPSQQMRDLGIVQYGAPALRDPARHFALPAERETIDAENLDAAKALLYPPQPVKEKPAECRPALGPGKGRHRRTAPTEDGR
ncbi:hypothetical protein PL81_08100 [Streptomyces sp. RSD-27]|nr:hypothetical protein PL81_08100 [Streptomyces sp. RSD-27]